MCMVRFFTSRELLVLSSSLGHFQLPSNNAVKSQIKTFDHFVMTTIVFWAVAAFSRYLSVHPYD
jgi:hypothetical protein